MTVTLQDVAEVAGVNLSTASRALSGTGRISPETRAKVKKIAQELGYQPNQSARILAGKKSRLISFVVPEIDSGYFAKLIYFVEMKLQERGYSLIIANSQFIAEKEAKAIETFANNNVDGIFIASSINFENHKIIQKVKDETNIAVVLLEALANHEDYNYVMIDDTCGMEKSIEYLLGKGHKKIGFISDPILDLIRKPMYIEALRRNNLNEKDHPLISHPSLRYEQAGYEVMNRFLDMPDMPTAILAGYDDLAIGAIRAIEDRGLHVPEDVAIIGNDDIRQAPYLNKKLTTLSPPVEKMAELGVELMLGVIENKDKDVVHHIVLKPNLIIRETT